MMFGTLLAWIDKRWPVKEMLRLALEEEIVGGPRFSYTLGSALIFTFAVQAITGIWQLFYYVPTVNNAYDSLNYMRTRVPFGWLIHNLHYWGANAMVVLVVVHMCRVFIWGSYKNPREMTWLAGVFLFLLTMALMFTGACLPWDELGYWATQVGTSIAGTVPFMGEFVKRLARGGETMGQLTLSRFFITHVAILPSLLMTMIAVHLVALRRFGETGPWKEAKRQVSGPFWPDQLFRDTATAMALFVLLVGLSVFFPPAVSGPADPLDTSYLPKPEWNFLFLYQALKYFKGPFEPVGTVGLPLAGTLLLLLVPFIDRNRERNPLARPFAMTAGFLTVAGTIALTIVGHYSHPGALPAAPASSGVPKEAASPPRQEAGNGPKLFSSLGCNACHKVNGKGGSIGPDLSGEGNRGRSRQWLMVQIRDPKSHFPGTVMPSFNRLQAGEAEKLADYLLTLKAGAEGTGAAAKGEGTTGAASTTEMGLTAGGPPGPGRAAYMIGSATHGGSLFALYCVQCHGPRGTDNILNPGSTDGKVPPLNPIDRALFNSDPVEFAKSIDRIIQHGSRPAGPSPALVMQSFGDHHSLSQEEIADIEAYVLSLNGVERDGIVNPGMTPRLFFFLVLVVSAGAGVAVAVLWRRQ